MSRLLCNSKQKSENKRRNGVRNICQFLVLQGLLATIRSMEIYQQNILWTRIPLRKNYYTQAVAVSTLAETKRRNKRQETKNPNKFYQFQFSYVNVQIVLSRCECACTLHAANSVVLSLCKTYLLANVVVVVFVVVVVVVFGILSSIRVCGAVLRLRQPFGYIRQEYVALKFPSGHVCAQVHIENLQQIFVSKHKASVSGWLAQFDGA